jgi:hypothetical protein
MADEWDEPPTEAPVFDHEGDSDPVREAPRHHEIAEEWDAHEPLDLQEPPAPMEELNSHEPARAETPPPAAAPRPGDAPPPGPAHGDHLGEETAEFDVEAEEFEDGEGDDVLEETPEFLQDTPDHDRLWFEQRPPRDFDFDG